MRDDRLLTAEGPQRLQGKLLACLHWSRRRRRPLAGFEPKSCNLKMPVRVYNFVLLRAMDKATYGSTSPSRPTAPTGWRLLQPASQWRRATLQLINVSVKKKDTWKRKGKQKKKNGATAASSSCDHAYEYTYHIYTTTHTIMGSWPCPTVDGTL